MANCLVLSKTCSTITHYIRSKHSLEHVNEAISVILLHHNSLLCFEVLPNHTIASIVTHLYQNNNQFWVEDRDTPPLYTSVAAMTEMEKGGGLTDVSRVGDLYLVRNSGRIRLSQKGSEHNQQHKRLHRQSSRNGNTGT